MKIQNMIIALLIICMISISACTNSLSENKPAGKCTKEYMPVCGTDGRTYSNKCMAGKTGIAYDGICLVGTHNCSEAEKNNKACTLEYLPVCGNDNKTYGNKCSACATGIDSWKMGECKSETEHICTQEEMEKIACTMDYNPVCGNDKNTYPNGCSACAAKVTKWKNGECKIN